MTRIPESKKKIKFSITLNPDCYHVLTEFAKVTGTSKSAFISEVIESQMDTLKGLTKTVKKAQKDAVKKVSLLDT